MKGIGEKTAVNFYRAGIKTVEDLLSYYPRTYETYDKPVNDPQSAADGQILAVCGFLCTPLSVRYIKGMQIVTGQLRLQETDNVVPGNNMLPVTWFNMAYLRSSLKPGIPYIMRGTVKLKGKRRTLTQPAVFSPSDYSVMMKTLQPVYPLVEGLRKTMLQKAVRQALDGELPPDCLPEQIRQDYGLAGYAESVREIHFPRSADTLIRARNRLVFDEFLLFIMQLKQLRIEREKLTRTEVLPDNSFPEQLIHSLSYTLTGAQKRIWDTIRKELTGRKPMARLIQGDVGSGKTILAFLAMVFTAAGGAQAALMVPTEVLAKQHYQSFLQLCGQFSGAEDEAPFGAVLLTGSVTGRKKQEIRKRIASGEALIVIGTHALFQEKVDYKKLSLVVTDEQHRFGVAQRDMLYRKGDQAHLLVMSATPIPRTLAGILYKDLDISTVNEMPAGRIPVKTCVITSAGRGAAYRFLKKEVDAGHQCYVICPMVEESDGMEAQNVSDYTEQLQSILPGITIEGLHGRMRSDEKLDIMERFSAGKISILVSTTVIEVGVNVPNATVMMIEDAQRFGLAQLHQLRGRVGRGNAVSYCILINSDPKEAVSQRLEIMNTSNDGFEIAAKDLAMRGPGDLFGTRQSGEMAFVLADIYRDAKIMQMANEAADRIFSEEVTYKDPQYALFYEKMLLCQNISLKNRGI